MRGNSQLSNGRRFLPALRAALALAIGIGLLSTAAVAQQFPFLPVAGAPTNIRALFQDSRGRLWMAGDRLACFDGARIFYLSDYGFPAAQTYSIAEDSRGGIWVGAETGVYHIWQGRVEELAKGVAVSVTPASPEVAIAAMGPAGKGLPKDASLVRIAFAGGKWNVESIADLDSAGPMTPDHSGNLTFSWASKGGWSEVSIAEIAKWTKGASLAIQRHAVPGESETPAVGPERVLRDRYGCVWIASDATVFYNCGGDSWLQPIPGASLRSSLSESPDGAMLLTGYSTLALGRPGSFREARAVNGLPSLSSAIQARDGTVWLGGLQGLFYMPSPFRMEFWTPRDGIDNPWAIVRHQGNMYAGLDRHLGVLGKDRQHWQSIASFDSIGQVMNLASLPDGNLAVALNPGGVELVHPDGAIVAHEQGKAYYDLRLAQTPDSSLWVGGITLGRVIRRGSALSLEKHAMEVQPMGNVLGMQYEPHTHKLWACYTGGLAARSDDGTWREFHVKDGLLTDPCWSLAALPNGDVWYGYYNTPAFAQLHPEADGRYSVRQFRAADEVRDPESIQFGVDGRGWIWRGGNQGVSIADGAEAAAGKWLYFTRADGLSGEGVNTGSYFADDDGSIWLGIDLSIFHYLPPADLLAPQFAPQIFLSAYSWNGSQPRLAEAAGNLPHSSNAVAHIGSLQFDRRGAIRVRYRILPGGNSWRETSKLDIPLTNLASGSHTLEVQARLFTGPWSQVLHAGFIVAPPFWQTAPMLFFYLAAGIAAAASGFQYRRKRLAEEAALWPDLGPWYVQALAPKAHELTGTLLDGRFEAGPQIEAGGFAAILEGYDRVEKRRCAIKLFHREPGQDEKIRERIERNFRQEVASLEKVRHPHVVSIYAHGTAPSGAPYLVMEFIEGETLRRVLEAGPLRPRRAARLLRQIASALDAIHAHGICHRDLKPENIMLRKPGTGEESAVLIDFSIAIFKDASATLLSFSRGEGSLAYMPLEQAVGYASTGGDAYSLAKVAIEMLAGRRLSELLPGVWMDFPERVPELLRGLPLNLSEESVRQLAAALAFDPSQRPQVASVVVNPVVRDLESGDGG